VKEGLINNRFSYTGAIEDYEKILNDAKDNYERIKEDNHPLVSITDSCSFENIEYFSTETIFIIDANCSYNSYSNYSDYNFFSLAMDYNFLNVLKNDKFFYVKIGKKSDEFMVLFIIAVFCFNLIPHNICYCIIRRKIRKIFLLNRLPIYHFISSFYYLFLCFFNCFYIFILALSNPVYDIVIEYTFLFAKSFVKSFFYCEMIFILQGWNIIDFKGIKRKKYIISIVLYELLVPTIFNLSLYFINLISKLTFYFLKCIIELILILAFIIYNIKTKLIPLYKQIDYERIKRSNLIECLKFKFKKLLRIYLVISIFCILILFTLFIEYQTIHIYIHDHYYHIIFISIYYCIVCAALNFTFISKRLPLNYFEAIIYDYKEYYYLIADISDRDNKNKNNLNISNLNLKNITNEKYPIVFINPFTSSKDKYLINKIHLGFVNEEL